MSTDDETTARLTGMPPEALRGYPTPAALRDLIGALMERHGADADVVAAAAHAWCAAKFRREHLGRKPPPAPSVG